MKKFKSFFALVLTFVIFLTSFAVVTVVETSAATYSAIPALFLL